MSDLPAGYDLMLVEDSIWLLKQQTNNPAYDFAFDASLACRRPWHRPDGITAVARVGAPQDYDGLFRELNTCGITILGWQRCVIREFMRLRAVKCDTAIKVQPSFDFVAQLK